MDSYKRGNENLQNAKKESHVPPLGENFVLSSILKPTYVDLSTKFQSTDDDTIIVQVYAVFTPSQFQHSNFHNQT